jgi:hypothetical protein
MTNAHNSLSSRAVVSRGRRLVDGIKMKGKPGCLGSQGLPTQAFRFFPRHFARDVTLPLKMDEHGAIRVSGTRVA